MDLGFLAAKVKWDTIDYVISKVNKMSRAMTTQRSLIKSSSFRAISFKSLEEGRLPVARNPKLRGRESACLFSIHTQIYKACFGFWLTYGF